MMDNSYEPRLYRRLFSNRDFRFFEVCIGESDLCIGVQADGISKCDKPECDMDAADIDKLAGYASDTVRKLRNLLEKYIIKQPEFLSSLKPVAALPDAPEIVKSMCDASMKAGVGPMAAVAGAIAEMTGCAMLEFDKRITGIIVENGGDIFVKLSKPLSIGISAGKSPLSGKLALLISPAGTREDTPAGICTSSGTVGHSLSFGKADAAMVIATDAFIADAAATAFGNMIKTHDDLPAAVEAIMKIEGVIGALGIMGDRMSAMGRIELVPAACG